MSNLDLTNLGVQELSEAELATIEGGNIFKDAWNGVKSAAETVGDVAKAVGEWEHVFLQVLVLEQQLPQQIN